MQADLKTFSALGVYGASAVVAVVDENTVGVYGVHPIPESFVAGQIRSVIGDIGADAVKIGMLHSSPLIRTVLSTLREYPDVRNIVLDPNLPEASLLLGETVDHQDQLEDAARELSRLTGEPVSVMLKAGHLEGTDQLVDIFYNAEKRTFLRLASRKLHTPNTHGTGCTLSSAIAAYLAQGADLDTAARLGKDYIAAAVEAGAAYQIGHGHGPVHHFHRWWQ